MAEQPSRGRRTKSLITFERIDDKPLDSTSLLLFSSVPSAPSGWDSSGSVLARFDALAGGIEFVTGVVQTKGRRIGVGEGRRRTKSKGGRRGIRVRGR
ncbi:unnamed protein product [Linum trigynum]|uniref:Uncharacterized protein n=1 Tax=Linum trigynum TaxID=586398 RepID=A0AAV2DJB9_9ROSI